MKVVVIITSVILIIWYIITRLEPASGSIVLNESALNEMKRNALTQKVLWGIMILMQSILCYKLYKLTPTLAGIYKVGIQVFFTVVILSLIIATIIFFIGLTSFWF